MVHVSGHADTPTLPAPNLTRRTCPVGYWTPETQRDRLKIEKLDGILPI